MEREARLVSLRGPRGEALPHRRLQGLFCRGKASLTREGLVDLAGRPPPPQEALWREEGLLELEEAFPHTEAPWRERRVRVP